MTEQAVKILCSDAMATEHEEIAANLLPFLLIVKNEEAVIPLTVFKSKNMLKNDLFAVASKSKGSFRIF